MAKSYGQSQSGKDIVTFDSLQPHLDGLEDDLNDEINKKVSSSDLFDANGKVKSGLLPSFVDDVLEFASRSAFPATGESGKIYIALDTNKTYRWGGTTYVEIAAGLALGETTGTAYEGSKGKSNATNIATLLGYFVEGVAKVAAKLSHKITFKGGVVGTFDGSEDKEVTIPSALSDLTPDATHRTVTDTEKAGWNAKYDKPSDGIPNSDLVHPSMTIAGNNVALGGSIGADTIIGAASSSAQFAGTAEKAKSATSATNAINAENDSKGNPIHTTYETKTDSENKEVTSATFDATKLTLTKRGGGKVEVDVPTFNQNTTGKAATAGTADEAKNLTEDAPTIVDETFTTKTLTKQNEAVEVQSLKGNSVVWNQHVKNGDFSQGMSNWILSDITGSGDNGILKVVKSEGRPEGIGYAWQLYSYVVGHIYMFFCEALCVGESFSLRIGSNLSSFSKLLTPLADAWTPAFILGSLSTQPTRPNILWIASSTYSGSSLEAWFRNVQLIDLTQMFGAGNEPATYEEFLARKPKVADEFAYDEGTIVNNKVEAIKSTGVNLWDEQWENGYLNARGNPVIGGNNLLSKHFISVKPNTTIYITQPSGGYGVYFYGANKNFIKSQWVGGSSSEHTIPSGCEYIKFYNDGMNTYNHDICINISDPSINGKYFPYEAVECRIDVTKLRSKAGELIFTDGMKKAGNAYDEIVGRKATKRLGVKVFDGTENWARAASGKFYLQLTEGKANGGAMAVGYDTLPTWNDEGRTAIFLDQNNPPLLCMQNDDLPEVYDWKSHLADLYAQGNPLTVIYELASPIEYELEDALTIALPALQGSTLEVVGESTAPLNATMAYYKNARKVMRDLIGAMSNFMSRQRDEVVNGIKDFINGIKVAGHSIWYDAANNTLMIDGNVAATGGLSSGGIQQARSTRGATGFVAEIDATANVPVSIENEVGTTNIVVSVYDRTNNAMVLADVVISPTQITVTTTQTKQLKVVVIGL